MTRSKVVWLQRLLVVNLGSTCVAAIILVLFRKPEGAREVFEIVASSFVYANTIAGLAWAVLWGARNRLDSCNGIRRWFEFTIGLLVVSAVGCLIAVLITDAIGLHARGNFWSDYFGSLGFCAVLSLMFGISSMLYETIAARLAAAELALRTRELSEERARKLEAEARLSSLESRIHPHFLFNTLNSIASLIPENPKLAEELVGNLAALLRTSLDANQKRLVPASQELQIVRDYLEIETARYGSRLRYAIDVPAELEHVEVPPLALQSLVENSVKHVVALSRDGAEIRLTGKSANGRASFSVADGGPGFRLDEIPPGHGLDNLLQRIDVLYDGAARLETSAAGVVLTVPRR